jgi:branched-chain amino acid transport system ATP-binding protein
LHALEAVFAVNGTEAMTLLSIEDIGISFGGVAALSNFTATIPAGQIVGIIGPNGAGKTTLLNVICGLYHPHQGRITLFGHDATWLRPDQVARLGLARTFQSSRLFAGMSVLENLMVGLHVKGSSMPWSAAFATRRSRGEERDMRDKAVLSLAFVGLAHLANRPGTSLSFGQQRIVEIARALVSDPKIVLLDEPAVGLSINRLTELDMLLRRARDEKGITFVMIEHVIRLVMGVSDRVIVMNAGAKIADASPKVVRNNPQVIEAYLGKGSYALGLPS